MNLIENISRNIYPLEEKYMEQAKVRLDRLIKPTGSLGKMEKVCAQLAGIYGKKYFDTSKKAIIAFGADHGVYEEGVAPDPQNITILQFQNFPKKINGVGTISKFVGADVLAVDVGINCDEKIDGVMDYKIRKGTSNMAKGPAMTRDEAQKCLEIGIEMAEKCIQDDYILIGIGEMGIANTTPSTAIISVFDNCDPSEITGMGAGLKKELLKQDSVESCFNDEYREMMACIAGAVDCSIEKIERFLTDYGRLTRINQMTYVSREHETKEEFYKMPHKKRKGRLL